MLTKNNLSKGGLLHVGLHFRATKRFLLLILFILCGVLPRDASAQWVSESYPLKAGWNGIWLSQDCSDRPLETVLAQYPQITEIWRWNPLSSTVQYVNSPSQPIKSDAKWAV